MRNRTLWVLGAVFGAVGTCAGLVWAEDRPTSTTKDAGDRVREVEVAPDTNMIVEDVWTVPDSGLPNVISSGLMDTVPVPRGTVFQRYVIGADGAERVVAGVERRIYSNTEGRIFAKLGGNKLVADDITTTAPHGTLLSRYTFQVTGKVEPAGQGGAYSVEFGLYSQCPQSVRSADRPGLIIEGTGGTVGFTDDAPRQIEFVVPGDVIARLPTNFFLGVKLSHDNVGIVVGAPAFEGHSADKWDFPPFVCASFLGGFPAQPHASFNAEIFDREDSGETHVEYKAQRLSGPRFNPGSTVWLVDDLEMLTPNCEMVAYEVAIKGQARYDFEFRTSCNGVPIAGTTKALNNNDDDLRLYRVSLNEPVALPQRPWFAVKVSNTVGGTVVAGTRPTIGDSENFFGVINAEGACELETVGTGVHAALHLTVTCAGAAPKGACCDMFLLDEDGEAVCRQLAEINCPFPPRGTGLRPGWQEGDACGPDNPFIEGTCGQAACCFKDENDDEHCENLTRNECGTEPPLVNPRQWQLGRFCGLTGQKCPLIACLARQGDCKEGRVDANGVDLCFPPPDPVSPDLIGCRSPDCCTAVCTLIEQQAFCCTHCWDAECAVAAGSIQVAEFCSDAPSNDDCSGTREDSGATPLSIPGVVTGDGVNATAKDTEPDLCCHNGFPLVCVGGIDDGAECKINDDCKDNGVCSNRLPRALGTVWYSFLGPDNGSVEIDTCTSSNPALDSLIQVFSALDDSSNEAACNSLSVLACVDDTPGCSGGGNGRLCLENLVPGDRYYIMVGGKTPETEANYRLQINSPCSDAGAVPNDFCQNAEVVTDTDPKGPGIPFDMTEATLHCPGDLCTPDMENDLWFDYTSTCTGILHIDTCTDGGPLETNLMLYEGCDACPPFAEEPLVCSLDSDGVCDPELTTPSLEYDRAVVGRCYKIRLADQLGNRPTGELRISCGSVCDEGAVTYIDPPRDTVDARRPHPPNDPFDALGIDTIQVSVAAASGRPKECWSICETAEAGDVPNTIVDYVESPLGTYTMTLERPITMNATTRITYLGNIIGGSTLLRSHPGNVDGNFAMFADDIQQLVDSLGGGFSFGIYGEDIDHSGIVTPLDILDCIDLYHGAAQYPEQANTSRPSASACPQ